MKGALCFALLLLGCAREPWRRALPAAFLPALELRVAYRRARAQALIDSDRAGVGLSAFLRWTPRSAAAAIPSQAEQSPAVWLAPCPLEDIVCLSELAEAEAEVAAALRAVP